MPWPRTVIRCEPEAPARPSAPNVVASGASERIQRLAARLPPLGLTLRCSVAEPATAVPALDDSTAYTLARKDDVIDIKADAEWGALAALATMAQLGPAVATVREVRDAPRYPWRGLMIDTVRHFITLATLKRTVDAMWFYKLNVLHLHLTDDQAFRFRSSRQPELASDVGYTPEELAELVAYAADRGVRVVPELDMPGHTASWLAKVPLWRFGDEPATPSRSFGVYRSCIDPANPAVLGAVDALLEELAALFPDAHLHLGGDEAVALDRETQATFMARTAAKAMAEGRRPMAWDECLHPRLPRQTVVQAWRGLGARDAALAAGFDCVVSAPYYLDLFYPADAHAVVPDVSADAPWPGDNDRLRHVRAGIDATERAFRQQQPTLPSADAPGRLLGGEACLWTELVADDLLDARVWSRMPVIAEQLWHGGSAPALYTRMAATRRALAKLNIVPEDDMCFRRYPTELRPLLEMLEPVKWYRRLLGEQGAAEREGGLGQTKAERPYDISTPLTRPVDRLPPESLASRRAEADLAAGRPMARWTAAWRRQREALRHHADLLPELGAAADALAQLADVIDGAECDAAGLAGPFGEYLLPIALAIDRDRAPQAATS